MIRLKTEGRHLVFERDAAVGAWVGHCLDLDVVTQGATLVGAAQRLEEAIDLVVESDLARGADPSLRRSPPAEWLRLWGSMP